MIRDTVYDTLESELKRQGQLCENAHMKLAHAPEGFLYIRNTGKKYSYYNIIKQAGEKTVQLKITDRKLLQDLLEKTRNKALAKICRRNQKVLKRALRDYTPLNTENLLSAKQKELFLNLYLSQPPAPYKKAKFDPQHHIHETVCGEMVRSKGEVIIVNAFWHYGIPFNYEELFPFPDEDGNWYYPDFTIHCPDGTVIIWEHFGLLDKMDYCIHNAGKLHTYHENGYVIGKNLIITQDDNNGNCSTVLIYHIIENYIMPHFH